MGTKLVLWALLIFYEVLALFGFISVIDDLPGVVGYVIGLILIWVGPMWLWLHLRLREGVDWIGMGTGTPRRGGPMKQNAQTSPVGLG